jgi:hypothetical protein
LGIIGRFFGEGFVFAHEYAQKLFGGKLKQKFYIFIGLLLNPFVRET